MNGTIRLAPVSEAAHNPELALCAIEVPPNHYAHPHRVLVRAAGLVDFSLWVYWKDRRKYVYGAISPLH